MSYESRCIRDAVEEINRTYFLPAIQREFVWDTYRIEEIVQYLVEIIYGPRTLAFQAAFFKSF